MNDPEGFLARWNRRKHEANADAAADAEMSETTARQNATEPASAPDDAPCGTGPVGTSAVGSAPPVPAFDVASLPPIESITSASDIRAFLAPGVPAELARAALRRAWSADPTIRDFIGIAENQWDFTAPSEILGFGPLESGEEITRLVAEVFGDGELENGRAPDDPKVSAQSDGKIPAAAAETDHQGPASPESDVEVKRIVHRSENTIAAQYSEEPADDLEVAHPRGHGRALPQ